MSSGCDCGCKSAAGSCEKEFQYAVKVVCGVVSPVVPGTATPPNPVAPGHYYTAINIHNPAKCGCITFRFKAAQALPWQTSPTGIVPIGTVTQFRSIRLCADQAVEIDNAQILGMFPRVPFIKGYVVIESPEELDVVAVYTVAQDFCGPCHGFYTERVPARCVPVCEDLILPISTGVADWQTVSAPSVSSPGPVVKLTGLNTNWLPAPSGSAWVSAAAGDSNTARPGDYTYDLSFELCSGFSNPVLQMGVLTDNSSKIYLNPPNQIGTTPNTGFSAITSITALSDSFVPGKNVLRVVVTNDAGDQGNPTGFAISGLLRVQGGRCPCASLPLLPAVPPRRVFIPTDNPGTEVPVTSSTTQKS